MKVRLTTKEQEELVINNLRLINYLVDKLGVSPDEFEDIVSIGKFGLIKAAASFDPSKGIKFSTYASKCINSEIFRYLKDEKKKVKFISLNDPYFISGEGDELTFFDVIPSPEKNILDEVADKDLVERLVNIILNLFNSNKRLIMLYKLSGMDICSIAEILNISRAYVYDTEPKLRDELKLYLTEPKRFNKVFAMTIEDNCYRFWFSSIGAVQFKNIYTTIMKKAKCAKTIPDFKVFSEKQGITVRLPARQESFYFIAQIIQEIDNFSV